METTTLASISARLDKVESTISALVAHINGNAERSNLAMKQFAELTTEETDRIDENLKELFEIVNSHADIMEGKG